MYRDLGLKWEKITSFRPPTGIDAIYSLRITRARRATACRDGDFMRLLTIAPDHDATYGKKVGKRMHNPPHPGAFIQEVYLVFLARPAIPKTRNHLLRK